MHIKQLNEELKRILLENKDQIGDDLKVLYDIQGRINFLNACIENINFESKKLGYDYKFNNGSYDNMKDTIAKNHKKLENYKNEIAELKEQEKVLKDKINNDLESVELYSTDLFISNDTIKEIVNNIRSIIKKDNSDIYGSSPIDLLIKRVDGKPVLEFKIPWLRKELVSKVDTLEDTNSYNNIDFTYSKNVPISDNFTDGRDATTGRETIMVYKGK